MDRRWWAGPGSGRARPGPSIVQRMGCDPVRPIDFSEDGPRPGVAHHIKKKTGAVRPIIFSNVSSRPAPSNGVEVHETWALYGPARQLRGPDRGFDGLAYVFFPY